MDKNPFSKAKKNSLFSVNKYFAVILSAIFVFLLFSCSDTSPEIINVDAKVIYDYESSDKEPVQKMSLFLKMDSEVRRAQTINIYHEASESRWVINEPVVTQAENYQYAGYTNICATKQDSGLLPLGKYTVCYIDAAGRDTYSEFTLNYDTAYSRLDFKKALEKIKTENAEIMIGIYSAQSNLIYFGSPEQKWNITYKYSDFDTKLIFNRYSTASFFRVFFFTNGAVFVMPQIYKNDNDVLSSEESEKIKKEDER